MKISCAPALSFSLALALAAPAAAAELPGLRVSSDPALPVAGHPLRVALDFSATGDSTWCRWQRDEFTGGPFLEFDEGTLVLWVYRADPALPCIGVPPTTVDFDVPASEVSAGFLPIEVRRHTGFLVQETLGRAGVAIQPDAPVLALQGKRFHLSVTYVDPRDGQTKVASAVRTSEESGTFWFFDPENPEVLVKLLDGEGVNGYYWLFASSLTTLEFTLEVLDSAGGCLNLPVNPPACPSRTYHHPAGPSRNFEDVTSLAAASPGPEPPIPYIFDIELTLDPALPHRGDRVRVLSNFGNDSGWCYSSQGEVIVSGSDHVVYLQVLSNIPPILPPPCGDPPPGLPPYVWEIDTATLLPVHWANWRVAMVYDGYPPTLDYAIAMTDFELRDGTAPPLPADRLLLHPEQPPAGQFVAWIDWRVPANGERGRGTPTRLSADSGYFTFFDPSNVEVTLKILDGRPINGHWWLFVASQTRQPYTLTVARGFDCGFDEIPAPSCDVYTFDHPEGPPQNRVDIEAFAEAGP